MTNVRINVAKTTKQVMAKHGGIYSDAGKHILFHFLFLKIRANSCVPFPNKSLSSKGFLIYVKSIYYYHWFKLKLFNNTPETYKCKWISSCIEEAQFILAFSSSSSYYITSSNEKHAHRHRLFCVRLGNTELRMQSCSQLSKQE